MRKKHRDWFHENNQKRAHIISEGNKAHKNFLSRPCKANKQRYKYLQREVQLTTRILQNTWWEQQARDMQACADEGRVQNFYEGIKRVSGPISGNTCPIKDTDGTKLLKDNDKIWKRGAEHYPQLLNNSTVTYPAILEEVP